jgi:nucleoside-diphosphate-sugar epimerase
MRVLVTGGTGFTGSALTRRLLEQGHDVVALDNKPGLFDGELAQKGAEIHVGSVTDEALVDRLVKGCARVYHLAAAFRLVNLAKRAYWDINVEGTRNLLDAALRRGVERFVYCSTCGVHGNVEHPPAAEDAPVAPADYYQYTKWEGEIVAREYINKGLWISIVRPAAIYGPGDPERFAMLYRRVSSGRFVFLGRGEALYHPCYIDNLVDALILAAEKDDARGQAYLIADERYVPIKELVTAIARELNIDLKLTFVPFWPAYAVAAAVELAYKPLPAEPPIFRRRLDWFRQNRAFDITKAKRELGWQPRVDLETGLRRTAEWYSEQGII